MCDFEQVHRLSRLTFHLRRHVVIGPDSYAPEESREHDLVAGEVARAHLHPVVGDEPELIAQLEQMPAVASENTQRPRLVFHARIQLARNQLDEGRLAGSVGPEDSDMLALRDGK